MTVGGSVRTPMVGLLNPEAEVVRLGGPAEVFPGVDSPRPTPPGEEGGVLLVDPDGVPLGPPRPAAPGGVGMPTLTGPGGRIRDAPAEDPGIRDRTPGIREDGPPLVLSAMVCVSHVSVRCAA